METEFLNRWVIKKLGLSKTETLYYQEMNCLKKTGLTSILVIS